MGGSFWGIDLVMACRLYLLIYNVCVCRLNMSAGTKRMILLVLGLGYRICFDLIMVRLIQRSTGTARSPSMEGEDE